MGGGGDTHPSVPPPVPIAVAVSPSVPHSTSGWVASPPQRPPPPHPSPSCGAHKGSAAPRSPRGHNAFNERGANEGGAQLKCHRGGLGLRPDVTQRSARGSPPAPSLPNVPVRALPPPYETGGGRRAGCVPSAKNTARSSAGLGALSPAVPVRSGAVAQVGGTGGWGWRWGGDDRR